MDRAALLAEAEALEAMAARFRAMAAAAPGAPSGPVADDTWPPDHRTLNFGDRQIWTDTATAARIANVSEDEMRRLCKTYPIALRPRGRWFVQKERLRRLLASGDLS